MGDPTIASATTPMTAVATEPWETEQFVMPELRKITTYREHLSSTDMLLLRQRFSWAGDGSSCAFE